MIVARFKDAWGGLDFGRIGVLNDLRCVIARFMGRDEPAHTASRRVLMEAMKEPGTWFELDGGALRFKAFKVGTIHLEIHPLVAERLNSVLSFLHPMELAAARKSKRGAPKAESVPLRFDLLPFSVLAVLESASITQSGGQWLVRFEFAGELDAGARAARAAALAALGRMGGRGVPDEPEDRLFTVDPTAALREMANTGVEVRLPDAV